ncbi:MAG: acyltransferase, partial [Planctomycetes bacterium]|nr:acyltransferase [Planctomycetota bacterium]
MRLSDVDSGRQNNMDLIRFIAASAVIYGHAFHLQNLRDPLEGVTGHSTGSLAVGIFFCLSGFLIAKSLCNRPSLLEFLLARCLRILPALIVVNIAVVLVAGLFWTDLTPAAFFADSRSWTYVLWNSSLLKCQYELPGVFVGNAYGDAVNGSLWTLPVEARMYGLVFAAGVASLLVQKSPGLKNLDRRRVVGLFGLVAFLLSAWIWSALSIPYVSGVFSEGGVLLMGYFGVGMMAHVMRDHVRLSGWVVLCVAALLASISESGLYEPVFFVWLAYTCLWLSYTPLVNARNFGKRGDVSYGIYIFAFPVQQYLYSTSDSMAPLTNAMLAFVIVLPLAA